MVLEFLANRGNRPADDVRRALLAWGRWRISLQLRRVRI